MLIAFILTMPKAMSWNGKWTDEGKLYVRVINIQKNHIANVLKEERYYYKWEDGWMACVEVRKVDGKEAAKLRRKSKGFCNYEWMIKSIIEEGEILCS